MSLVLALQEMLDKSQSGSWIATSFLRPDGREIETVDHVIESISHSVRFSDRAELWGVMLDEEDNKTICYTGNGPNGQANAYLMANARRIAELCIKLVGENEALRADNHRLRTKDYQ